MSSITLLILPLHGIPHPVGQVEHPLARSCALQMRASCMLRARQLKQQFSLQQRAAALADTPAPQGHADGLMVRIQSAVTGVHGSSFKGLLPSPAHHDALAHNLCGKVECNSRRSTCMPPSRLLAPLHTRAGVHALIHRQCTLPACRLRCDAWCVPRWPVGQHS